MFLLKSWQVDEQYLKTDEIKLNLEILEKSFITTKFDCNQLFVLNIKVAYNNDQLLVSCEDNNLTELST